MTKFEYKVVPAPRKGQKSRGVRSTEDRFAHALAGLMNELGAEGWEYQRTDTLPCEERTGFTGRTTVFQNMLVFRRVLDEVGKAEVPTEKRQAEKAPVLSVPLDSRNTAPLKTVPGLIIGDGAAPKIGPAKGDIAAR